ncbi:MAG TPA: tRNA (guanosine(37)-N1)-methyltransferase TrmD, partial [candidate division Zixibacteria bacterium]|nr:tRNA (guanosine(37)-N1)-methyltransferase TrmD [candidate division Zixibacteria bacterium]
MSVGESTGAAGDKLTLEIVTLFPGYFEGVTRESILGRGLTAGLFDIRIVNLREFGLGKHRIVDDTPYGGGGGMVLMLEPLVKCLNTLGYRTGELATDGRLLLTSAAGEPFRQDKAVELSLAKRVTIICGHYLGVDERLLDLFPIEEISIGDYVLTGGEPAAAVIVDAICRLVPGALGDFSSALADSHQERILGAPVYTRPENFAGLAVPEELKSGDHKKIAEYRRREALRKTALRRPEI